MSDHPITYTIPGAMKASGLSRSTIYNRIGDGSIEAVKAGGRTLLRGEQFRAFLAGLPPAHITTGRSATP